MSRAPGWEARFVAALREASQRPYHAREWNCAKFVHTCAEALRAAPLAYAWKGSLEASVDAVLARVPIEYAQRGDVVLAPVPHPTLGLCLGAQCAFVGRTGLYTVRTSVAAIAWSV